MTRSIIHRCLLALLATLLAVSTGAGSTRQDSAYVKFYFKEAQPLRLEPGSMAILNAPGAEGWKDRLTALRVHDFETVPAALPEWSLVRILEEERGADAETLLTGVSEADGVLFASPLFSGESGETLWITPVLLVGLESSTSRAQASAIFAGLDILEENWAGMPNTFRLQAHAKSGLEVLRIANDLARRPEVRYAEPDCAFTGHNEGDPITLDLERCWALENTGQEGGTPDMDMDALQAWDFTLGDRGVIALVIDNGVDYSAPITLEQGFDPTGQGLGGMPVNECDNHGTAVAGCISAGMGYLAPVGIAPASSVSSARVFVSNVPCDGSWTTQVSWTVDALQFAESIGARITNNSNAYGFQWAAVDSKYLQTSLAGMTHFAAAGNDGRGSLAYPASLPTVLGVGAIDRRGVHSSFSNFGPDLDFVAPGTDILTTDRSDAQGYEAGDTAVVSGTSFASPFAAGVAALVLSHDPAMTSPELLYTLHASCVDLGLPGPDPYYGFGLLNSYRALLRANDNHSTTLLSSGGDGWISRDGRFVVSGTGVLDRVNGETTASGGSMSADGKHVAFMTNAQLSPEDQDSRADVYLVDRNLGTTRLLDTGTLNGDVVFPSLAANGRFVAFYFYSATWPVQSGVFVSDRDADTDGIFDETGAVTTVRVSVRTSGALPTSVISTYGVSISPDGRFVAFDMVTPDLAPPYTPPFGARADVYVHDRDPDQDGLYDEPGATTTVRAGVPSGGATLGNAASGRPSMSDAGVVVFESSSTNLVPGDTNEIPDVFTHDVVTGHTECVSVNSGELQALGAGTSGSVHASISADGRFVAFESEANNLVPADTNSSADVFRRDRMAGETVRVSVTADGFEITTLLFAAGENPHISADGDFVTFESDSLDIVPLPGFSYTTGNLYLRNLGNPEEASAPDRPCGINPSGSLTLLAGRPAIGMTMTLGVDNPLGTQNPGSLSLVAFSAQAVPTWPCGVLIRGAGMASRGAPGELFLRLPWLRIMGSPWTGPGSPAPVDVHIPLDPALMGLVVYAQGALIDPTAAVGGGVFVGLTRGMELQIGD